MKPVLLVLLLLPTLAFALRRLDVIARPSAARPSQRVALVIGNSQYQESPLLNPANDARDMAALLRQHGFDVLHGENLTQKEMKTLIRNFGDRLLEGGVGLFYFAGHDVQVADHNYLIPVGASIRSEAEWEYAARANTTTDFTFGAALPPELANYDGNTPYGKGEKCRSALRVRNTPDFRMFFIGFRVALDAPQK